MALPRRATLLPRPSFERNGSPLLNKLFRQRHLIYDQVAALFNVMDFNANSCLKQVLGLSSHPYLQTRRSANL